MDEMLTCSLCLEIFTQPQTFPCFHSFCVACIQKLPLESPVANQPQGYLCPLCRAFAREEDVRGNFLVNELLHMFRSKCEKRAVCLQCAEGVDSQWKCADCLIELCEKCHLSHLRIPVCRGHRVVPLDSQTEGVIDRLVFCTVHSDQPVMLNCADCEVPLCIKCKVTEHESHRTETVERAVERLRPVLQKHRQSIGGKLESLENELRDTSKVTEDTTETFTYCRESIEEKRQALISRITEEAQTQLDRLQEKQELELGKLEGKTGQIQNKMKEYCMLQDWIGTTLEKTRGAILLVECQSGLQQKVEKLVQQNAISSTITIEQPTYLSNPQHQAKSQGMMGRIEYNQVSVSSILPDLTSTSHSPTDSTTPASHVTQCLHRNNKSVHTDLHKLLTSKHWAHDTEVKVTEGHCAKVRIIDNSELWLPLFNQNSILVYTLDGKFLRKIAHESIKHPISVEFHKATVLTACETGLFVITQEGEMVTMVKAASFSDVSVSNRQMAGLEYSSQQSRCQVHLYLEREDDKGQGHPFWEHTSTLCFSVPNIDKFSAVLLKDKSVFVCPSNSHKIYSHRLERKGNNQQQKELVGCLTTVEISLHTENSLVPDENSTPDEARPVLNLTTAMPNTPQTERKMKSTSLPETGSSRTQYDHKPPIHPMKSPHTPQPQRRAMKSSSLPETSGSSKSTEQRVSSMTMSNKTPTVGLVLDGSDRKIQTVLEEYGSQGHQGAGKLYFPMMCGIDENSSILVADCHNRRLQILKSSGQWDVVESLGQGNETLEDVVIVSERVIWVLQSWNKLVRYTCTN